MGNGSRRTDVTEIERVLSSSARPISVTSKCVRNAGDLSLATVRRLICWSAAGEKSFPRVNDTGSRGLVSNCEPLGKNYEKVK